MNYQTPQTANGQVLDGMRSPTPTKAQPWPARSPVFIGLCLAAAVVILLVSAAEQNAGYLDLIGKPLPGALVPLAVWSLVVAAIWPITSTDTAARTNRQRWRYVLAWLIGMIAATVWLAPLLPASLPAIEPNVAHIAILASSLAAWTIGILGLYIYRGDGSRTWIEGFSRYRTVWLTFALVALVTILIGEVTYLYLQAHIHADTSERSLAWQSLKDLTDSTANMTAYLPHARDPDTLLQLQQQAMTASSRALSAHRELQGAIQSESTTTTPSLQAVDNAVSEVIRSTQEVSQTLAALLAPGRPGVTTPAADSGPAQPQLAILTDQVHDADARAGIALRSLEGASSDTVTVFLWISILFVALVLVPWMLQLMFMWRKQSNLVRSMLNDLRRLDPTDNLLRRAMPAEDQEGDRTPGRSGDEHLKLVQDIFGNREYVVSLLALTIIVGVGWHYIFYPETGYGLAQVIESGGGILEVTSKIISNLTPVTLSFAGAYLYVVQMLVRRYFADDLYPTAFLQAVMRFIVVFVIAQVLSVLTPLFRPALQPGGSVPTLDVIFPLGFYASMLASFFAGIFPDWAIGWLRTRTNMVLKSNIDDLSQASPLTRLEGIDLWVQSRLLEENIENIQTLASVSLEQLVIRTHYTTPQILYWVDQAILYTHAGKNGEWFDTFQHLGIHTASALLRLAGYIQGWPGSVEKVAAADAERVMVQATTGAKDGDAAVKQQGNGPLTARIVEFICQSILPEQNLGYILNYYEYKLIVSDHGAYAGGQWPAGAQDRLTHKEPDAASASHEPAGPAVQAEPVGG